MNDTRLNLPISPSLKGRIEAAAGREGCGTSEWVRFALRRALIAEASESIAMARLETDPSDIAVLDDDVVVAARALVAALPESPA